MPKKITEESVRLQFINRGCTLLGDYKNAKQPMEYICFCGARSKISWDNFSRGHGCPVCAGVVRPTQAKVAEEFSKYGCELLDGYKNNHEKMRYRCSCGKMSFITLSNFRLGKRCAVCGKNKRPTQSEVENYFISHGCKLLTLYRNANQLLEYICKCGNKSKVRYATFLRGNRCRRCFAVRMSGSNHPNWNHNREEILLLKQLRKKSNRAVRKVFDIFGRKKIKRKSKDILGYSSQELKKHLESFPDWDVLKTGKWDLDHIFPIKAFVDYRITDITLINCLDNLQPLPRNANRIKWRYYDKLKFELWLKQKGIVYLN